MKIVTDLSSKDIKDFLLRSDSYCNIDLPLYVSFNDMLEKMSKIINQANLSNYSKDSPKSFENVNYSFMTNKDGVLSWRQFQIIHPVIYLSLVNLISEKSNWKLITQKLEQKTLINCLSIPIVPAGKKKSKAGQINSWWHNVEQKSLIYSLEYDFVFHTDITNFYPSIYTHSLAWSLHGKELVKKSLKNKKIKLLGNEIDNHLMAMNYGQTNGIPQGSVLMDLISEILLKEIDIQLEQEINLAGINKIKILRYRDDFRIFTNDKTTGYQVLQIISKVLASYGLSLNKFKTTNSSSIILSSIKEDKIALIDRPSKSFSSHQKQLLSIYIFSEKYPNSGSLIKLLSGFYEDIDHDSLKRENILVLISIISELMFKNPKATNVCSGILSKLLACIKKQSELKKTINQILKKSSKYPFTGMIQVWIQRITLGIGLDNNFEEAICKSIQNKNCLIWNNEWLNQKTKKQLEEMSFIDNEIIKKLKKIIPKDEFDIFSNY